ncbi:GNAT family N-acetyltransferase [Bacillus mycoides]|uniref:GNAT family N-acetyltransferase n=1 Tax=Bacillus mycoides TaxID=1405 RepID=A0ABX6ZE14_BACMY|nr:GNAT family N-acetyltransferase [Bacillus mycoides]AJH21232.1 acetyltransferase family protein [Bacillus mycoides]MDR4238240.1 GNAT family N-acetyltransferase [Bacillus mycoides]MED1427355.1 GNAT family N-acetyltransferase [Bacillus mycoides]MED1484749.1 GNAT family N-acetyltransferase [Bacillus mycoides]QQA18436.1 GNAT family N-acetyltransferase [Bacillus mycoides]
MNIHTGEIQLVPYKEQYKEIIQSFTLPSEQVQFTANPGELLEKAKNVVVILDYNGVPVGVFILQTGDRVQEFTENKDAILLTSFSINHNKQNKGYAKKSLALLQEFVKYYYPVKNEVILAVNEKNIPAQKLYEKVGFQDKGFRRMGPIGQQFILHLPITR